MEQFNDDFGSFYFNEGYTSNGFPYDVPFEEIEGNEDKGRNLIIEDDIRPFFDNEDLPF